MKRIPSVALGRHLFVIAGLALASTVSNLSAADTYYVSDHLATTTAVADAAGEIASLEADAFGSPVSGGEQAARYTGKPYDADIGAYVFPFRNYRSDEARWMSADPSGFPDGVNGRRYAPISTQGLDPLGLYSVSSSDNGFKFDLTRASLIAATNSAIDNMFNQNGGIADSIASSVVKSWAEGRIGSAETRQVTTALSGTADYQDSNPTWSNPKFTMASASVGFGINVGIGGNGYKGSLTATLKEFSFANYSGQEEPPSSYYVTADTAYFVYVKFELTLGVGVTGTFTSEAGAAGAGFKSNLMFTE